jgi:hypothetical protein
MNPTLRVRETRTIDLVHHYDADRGFRVVSRQHRFWAEDREGHVLWRGAFPTRVTDLAGPVRLARRFGRLDQCTLTPLGDQWIAIRNGAVQRFDPATGALERIGALRQCRVPLQLYAGDDVILFGEYGSNPERRSVPLWRIVPGGAPEIVYAFEPGRARHIHGAFRDPFSGRFWICSGDFEHESWLVNADADFRDVEVIGDGSQMYRAVTMFFFEDRIVWLTDSQFVQNHVMTMDRRTGVVTQGAPVPSPVWFGRAFRDGLLLAGCAWEHGAGCMRDGATLLASRDGDAWHELAFWKKDRWPAPWFRDGVIRFAPGPQDSSDFVLCGEGLVELDGRMLRCSLSGSAT